MDKDNSSAELNQRLSEAESPPPPRTLTPRKSRVRPSKSHRPRQGEWDALRCQIGILKLCVGGQHRRYFPRVFAEHNTIVHDGLKLEQQRAICELPSGIHRKGKEDRPRNGSGGAFEIASAESVAEPIAVGYGAHFGLGLFVPIENQCSSASISG